MSTHTVLACILRDPDGNTTTEATLALVVVARAAEEALAATRWPCHWCGGSGPTYSANHGRHCRARKLATALDQLGSIDLKDQTP